jgi:hypothetical protein
MTSIMLTGVKLGSVSKNLVLDQKMGWLMD